MYRNIRVFFMTSFYVLSTLILLPLSAYGQTATDMRDTRVITQATKPQPRIKGLLTSDPLVADLLQTGGFQRAALPIDQPLVDVQFIVKERPGKTGDMGELKVVLSPNMTTQEMVVEISGAGVVKLNAAKGMEEIRVREQYLLIYL